MFEALFWLILFLGGALTLAYLRTSLATATASYAVALLLYTIFGDGSWLWLLLLWAVLGGLVFLNQEAWRREFLSAPALAFTRRVLPSMSDTERDALEAGTVWWDGDLFSGKPDWDKLLATPAPRLSDEEQAFLDGPVEELCRMLDEWKITHELGDLPPEVWEFIKDQGFFAMIIPKSYGGLEFSALAHSEVLTKVASHSPTAASTIAVPNSLGPAELLIHYGTQEQKDRYLPGLAAGTEVPCFALTGPRAGSDAASITDSGVVCKGRWQGEEVIGIRLNWDKRYITLAPVATVLGLAFKLRDPDHLIGDVEDYGITCALIPTDTPGVRIGRRHFPLNIPFQNGPTQGEDVFVPLDVIIGGTAMAGKGWRMLMEQLAVGRCISLPSNATGGAKAASFATGAYSRIRRQFGLPVGKFEGVQEALSRIAGLTYIMDASRRLTAGAVDQGEKPAVASAILKYHCTEMGRTIANDAMDVHGGKGICLGPRNYLARGYQSVPIAITVEGANILTRSLIIFGQGAIRCHPYVLREMQIAQMEDEVERLRAFDDVLFSHIGYAISNAARSVVLAATHARFTKVPVHGPTRRYYQHINRYAAAFALVADFAMLSLGGALKRKERLSARLGDMLSNMYLASMVLKNYEDAGRPEEDLPLVEWACRHLIYQLQEQLHSFLRNFPNRWVAVLLRMLVFPTGRGYSSPSDDIGHEVAELIIAPTGARDRLCRGVYRAVEPGNPIGQLHQVMEQVIAAEPIQDRIRAAEKDGRITAEDFESRLAQAREAGVIDASELDLLRELDGRMMDLIHVDDFGMDELGTGSRSSTGTTASSTEEAGRDRKSTAGKSDKKTAEKRAKKSKKKSTRKKTGKRSRKKAPPE